MKSVHPFLLVGIVLALLASGCAWPGDLTTCICRERNTCCDGCKPRNEGAVCEDGSFCHVGAHCAQGICRGDRSRFEHMRIFARGWLAAKAEEG